ncbi:MAG TPA: amidohydrolase family protein [Gemmatimonadaceae bacterium]|nr:amidohydrolase family protein [Gemmatimonadaceae bacterium]
MPILPRFVIAALIAATIPTTASHAQAAAVNGVRPAKLIIRNATIIDGNGTPAKGPFDIVVEGNTITRLVALDPVALGRNAAGRRPAADATTAEIDATGKYVLPGLINAHAHLQDDRAGTAQPIDYELKIWLACGITAVRDVGSDTRKALAWRDASAKGTLAAPRLFIYPQFGRPTNADSARAHVRALKAMGVDGIKLLGIDRDIMAAMEDEAHKEGLRVAHHVGVEETNAWDDIHFGTTSIEHWYGIPDAAIVDGVQGFPSYYNYNNETDRFRWAGHLWREADPKRLDMVLDSMSARHVAWVPTFDIYEASRDLQRARTQPWFVDYLHPTLEDYFRPDPANHGSYFFGWTSTDETYWKDNYKIWMNAVREFERKGGLVGAGDDAGFIYQMYGFGLLRELELHQEAGFNPIKVIQHATFNNARILGKENELGRVRQGFKADLIVVNGNPLENLKVLYPTGVDDIKDGKPVHTGGVEWTIKDGIPYHGPTLMREVKQLVAKARAERGSKADKTQKSETGKPDKTDRSGRR